MNKTDMANKNNQLICFRAELFKIGSRTLLILPEEASKKLPSRGMVLVDGTINDVPFQTLLDPDGRGSHYFEIYQILLKSLKITSGVSVSIKMSPSANWPEPTVPPELLKLLQTTPEAYSLWKSITPMARWDWIRWIGSAQKNETRSHRIDVSVDKLKKGERRPCCFNRSLCTEPSISKNGVLLEPSYVSYKLENRIKEN